MNTVKSKITVIDTAKIKRYSGRTRWAKLLQEAELEQRKLVAEKPEDTKHQKLK